jgi:uncharacterized protein
MSTLGIISFDSCGKTALCAGIGKKLDVEGKKAGYIKPIHLIEKSTADECRDALFIKQVLEIQEPKDQLCPLHCTQEDLWKKLTEDIENFNGQTKKDAVKIAVGKNYSIVEFPGMIKGDKASALAAITMSESLDAKVIIITSAAGYKDTELLQTAEKLAGRLIGVVINMVPESQISDVKNESQDFLKGKNIDLLGVIPESRILMGISVADIAQQLKGDVINAKDKTGELVENVMLGAMTPDSGRDYFNRKKNKAVITASEKLDMQLAALETSTKCLVVTGKKPSNSVLVKAEDKKVPVIVVEKEITDVISGIESLLADARFDNQQKLKAMIAILDAGFDFKALKAAISL